MKFAVLGIDEDSLALTEAALADGETLVWADPALQPPHPLASLVRESRDEADWQILLSRGLADAVIVGRGPDHEQPLRQQQLLRLAQAAIPMLVVHPVCDSLLVYLEIDMVAREADGVLLHYFPGMQHPAIDHLRGLMAEAAGVESGEGQLVCERYMDSRDPQTVTRRFARDIDLLERLAGPFGEITALGGNADNYANLSVQLGGVSRLPTRWSVLPSGSSPPYGKITVRLLQEHVELAMPQEAPWTLAVTGTRSQRVQWDDARPAATAIAAWQRAIEGQRQRSTWRRAARAMELADTIELSLRKGRTIEVHFQVLNQQTSFRGTMAMAGCGLLLLLPLLIALAGVLGDVFNLPLLRFWYVPVLILMVLFLVLQVLVKLFSTQPKGEGEGSVAKESPGAEEKQGDFSG